ncbi:monocarboxylate transporter 12-B-like [Amphiura filiformis]|uniref:monocarboxylate transporter 12-B-like n=1 Tax=Amphiura filiformis TaxID=82378 RepID=UPI003B215F15
MEAPDHDISEPPGEGGWGYVILAGVFVTMFSILGWFQSQTFLFVEWQREFSSTSVEASVLVSTGIVIFGIFSPLASVLAARIGTRLTVMTGGMFVTIGMFATMFMESILGIILTWGVITGFGFALVFSTSLSMIREYFDEHFTAANSVAYTGAAIGQIFVPLLTDALVDAYGWRGALLLLSGIMSHLIAAGAVLRPRLKQTLVMQEMKVTKGDNVYENQAYEGDTGWASAKDSNSQDDYSMQQSTHVIAENTNDGKDMFGSPLRRSKPPCNNSSAVSSISKSDTPTTSRKSDSKGTAILIIKSLIRNIAFDIMMVVFFILGFVFFIPIAHTLPIALEAGISESKAALLPTIFGVGSFFGRLFPGFIADYFQIPIDIINIGAFVTCTVANAIIPFCNTFWHFVMYHFIYGGATGAFIVFSFTTVQLIQTEHRAFGVGIATFFFGVGDASGSICAGWLVDIFGGYDTTMWFTSGLAAICAILLVFVAILRRKEYGHEHQHTACPNNTDAAKT